MFSLCRRKVRSQAPCSFPVRSGSRNKATASVCGRKLFTQDSFRFSGSHSIDYKWPKNCAKKNMGAFYSLKKQSCFHNSSKLLLYVSERTSTRKCWPADYITAIKPAEQKPNVHHVLTFGMIPDLQATLCFQVRRWVLSLCIRNTWNIPTKEQLCDKPAQQHVICSRELVNKALLSDTIAKNILFSKKKDAGEVVFTPPMFSTNFIISKYVLCAPPLCNRVAWSYCNCITFLNR